MAIEGPLRELGLPDLLQLIHLSRKTGTLTVRADRGPLSAQLDFDRGAVVGAQAAAGAPRLGQLLLTAGKVTERQIERALVEQRTTPERRLGQILVDGHGVSREEVERQLRFQVQEAVFDLLRWEDGYFRFEEAVVSGTGAIGIRVSVEGLLLEALRRMDEWSALASGPPDTDLVPGLVDTVEGHAPVLALQPAEWEVLAAVDGERTLRAIARLLGQAEFEVAKVVFSLVSTGVIELRDRRVRVEPPPRRRPAAATAEAEIEAELRAGRLDEAERRLDELLRRDPERGELYALRGKIEAMRGEWRRALECLEQAVRHDPLLGAAYYALGMAALRAGEFTRAGDALETYLRLPDAAASLKERAIRASTLIAQIERLLEEESE